MAKIAVPSLGEGTIRRWFLLALAPIVVVILAFCRTPGMGSCPDSWRYAAVAIVSRQIGYAATRPPGYPVSEYLVIGLDRLHLPPEILVWLSIAASAVCVILLWRIFEYYKIRLPWLLAPAVVLCPAWAISGSQAIENAPAMAFLLAAWLVALRSDGPWTGIFFGLALATRWTSIFGLPLLWIDRRHLWRNIGIAGAVAAAFYAPAWYVAGLRRPILWFPAFSLISRNTLMGLGSIGLAAMVAAFFVRPRVPPLAPALVALMTVALWIRHPWDVRYLLLPLPFLVIIAAYRKPWWVVAPLAVALAVGTPGAVIANRARSAAYDRATAQYLALHGRQVLPSWVCPRVIVATDGRLRTPEVQFVLPPIGSVMVWRGHRGPKGKWEQWPE